MKGLIIKHKWAELILQGKKIIEVRGNKTKIRGTIGIIESGSKKVFGTAELFHCTELTKDKFEILANGHKLDITYEELINIYPKPWAWCFKDVIEFDEPKPYKHKRGCMIWVNI